MSYHYVSLLLVAQLVLPSCGLLVSRTRHSSLISSDHRVRFDATQNRSMAADPTALHSCMKGKRIVLIGPSTSMYDYFALTFFAEYGRWPVDHTVFVGPEGAQEGPNPLTMGLRGWNKFILPKGLDTSPDIAGCRKGDHEVWNRYTNFMLNGHEVCDVHCKGKWNGPYDSSNWTQNRIYTKGDTMISFFQWLGDVVPPRGSFDVSPALEIPPRAVAQKCPPGQFQGDWEWKMDAATFITKVVKQSRPTHLVISAAAWPVSKLTQEFWSSLANAGVEAVSDTGGKVYWRTTPRASYATDMYVASAVPKDTSQMTADAIDNQRTRNHDSANPADIIDTSLFTSRGWDIFDAKLIIEMHQHFRSQKNPTEGRDNAFLDDWHMWPHAVCALNEAFLSESVCRKT